MTWRKVLEEGEDIASHFSVLHACGGSPEVAQAVLRLVDEALKSGVLEAPRDRCAEFLAPWEEATGEKEGRDRGSHCLLKVISVMLRLKGFNSRDNLMPIREIVLTGHPLVATPPPARLAGPVVAKSEPLFRALELAVHLAKSAGSVSTVRVSDCEIGPEGGDKCITEVVRLVRRVGNGSLSRFVDEVDMHGNLMDADGVRKVIEAAVKDRCEAKEAPANPLWLDLSFNRVRNPEVVFQNLQAWAKWAHNSENALCMADQEGCSRQACPLKSCVHLPRFLEQTRPDAPRPAASKGDTTTPAPRLEILRTVELPRPPRRRSSSERARRSRGGRPSSLPKKASRRSRSRSRKRSRDGRSRSRSGARRRSGDGRSGGRGVDRRQNGERRSRSRGGERRRSGERRSRSRGGERRRSGQRRSRSRGKERRRSAERRSRSRVKDRGHTGERRLELKPAPAYRDRRSRSQSRGRRGGSRGRCSASGGRRRSPSHRKGQSRNRSSTTRGKARSPSPVAGSRAGSGRDGARNGRASKASRSVSSAGASDSQGSDDSRETRDGERTDSRSRSDAEESEEESIYDYELEDEEEEEETSASEAGSPPPATKNGRHASAAPKPSQCPAGPPPSTEQLEQRIARLFGALKSSAPPSGSQQASGMPKPSVAKDFVPRPSAAADFVPRPSAAADFVPKPSSAKDCSRKRSRSGRRGRAKRDGYTV